MNVGIDIHGVLDKYPMTFGEFSRSLISAGHKVYILTGQKRDKIMNILYDSDASFTDIYSILDFHIQNGTKITEDKHGLWMDDNIWVRTKGEFARKLELDYHFDDSPEYAEFFPRECKYILVADELNDILPLMVKLTLT